MTFAEARALEAFKSLTPEWWCSGRLASVPGQCRAEWYADSGRAGPNAASLFGQLRDRSTRTFLPLAVRVRGPRDGASSSLAMIHEVDTMACRLPSRSDRSNRGAKGR